MESEIEINLRLKVGALGVELKKSQEEAIKARTDQSDTLLRMCSLEEELRAAQEQLSNTISLDTIAKFTYMWGRHFFLETAQGNFIWSDPDYSGGDNTIQKYDGTYEEYLKGFGIPFGRCKGEHTIGGYCGDQVKILTRLT